MIPNAIPPIAHPIRKIEVIQVPVNFTCVSSAKPAKPACSSSSLTDGCRTSVKRF